MAVDWTETDSAAVARFGFDAQACELHVVFRAGRHYAYGPVSEDVMIDLVTARSIGQFVNTRIKPYFASREIDLAPPSLSAQDAGGADRRTDGQRQVDPGAETRR